MSAAEIQFIAFLFVAACWMGILGVAGGIVYGVIRLWRWAHEPINFPERFL